MRNSYSLAEPTLDLLASTSSQIDDRNRSNPSAEQVRDQLERILGSFLFVHCDRLSRFLRAVVEQALAGETDRMRECMLGVAVSDRGPFYDPRVDSSVRVQAHRVRLKLLEYYERAKPADSVLIELRQGSYIPLFSFVQPDGGPPPSAFAWPRTRVLHRRAVVVLPMLNATANTDMDIFCYGLTTEIVTALSVSPELTVQATTSARSLLGARRDLREIGQQFGAGTVIAGSVHEAGQQVRIMAKIVDASTGLLLWSEMFHGRVADVLEVHLKVARSIAESFRSIIAGAGSDPINVAASTYYPDRTR